MRGLSGIPLVIASVYDLNGDLVRHVYRYDKSIDVDIIDYRQSGYNYLIGYAGTSRTLVIYRLDEEWRTLDVLVTGYNVPSQLAHKRVFERDATAFIGDSDIFVVATSGTSNANFVYRAFDLAGNVVLTFPAGGFHAHMSLGYVGLAFQTRELYTHDLDLIGVYNHQESSSVATIAVDDQRGVLIRRTVPRFEHLPHGGSPTIITSTGVSNTFAHSANGLNGTSVVVMSFLSGGVYPVRVIDMIAQSELLRVDFSAANAPGGQLGIALRPKLDRYIGRVGVLANPPNGAVWDSDFVELFRTTYQAAGDGSSAMDLAISDDADRHKLFACMETPNDRWVNIHNLDTGDRVRIRIWNLHASVRIVSDVQRVLAF